MSELVWVKEYVESYGATVTWDDVTKSVVIDGIRVKPDYIEEGHAYVYKDKLDQVLTQLGYMQEYRTSRGILDALRGIPVVLWIQDKWEQLKQWVVDTIWSPVQEYFSEHLSGTFTILSSIRKIPNAIYNFISSVRSKFSDITDFIKTYGEEIINVVLGKVFESFKDVRDFFDNIRDKAILLFNDLWDKIGYLAGVIFNEIKIFFDNPVEYIAVSIVRGFDTWINGVLDLLEEYVDEHWEDDV